MALHQVVLVPNCNLLKFKMFPPQTKSLNKSSYVLPTIQCKASTVTVPNQNPNVRRSANFGPSDWSYDSIQSLRSEYGGESYVQERDRLKEEVRIMISKMTNDLEKLELIDVLEKLGVAAHFSLEISSILDNTYNNKDRKRKEDLNENALEFRLLRKHGYDVSPDIIENFKDNEGNFNTQLLGGIEGMLSLYEASFHSIEGETIFDEVRDFCSTRLKEFVNKNKDDDTSVLVSHFLERPLHWWTPRQVNRWFIDIYERAENMNPTLLKLAKLDFNIVQVAHQEDLKYFSRWWKEIGFVEKLNFARDRPVEKFFWGLNMAHQPDFGYFRREVAKIFAFITVIDDIYDVHGTMEELELFTEVVDRWDINAMDILPEYMKICFLALYNFVNDVAFYNLKMTGYNIILYLKKGWADICKSYLLEAKWYHNDYIPSVREYMENGWISIGGPAVLLHTYFLIPNTIRKKDLDIFLTEYPNLIRLSGTMLRLANDLGTYKREMETGDVLKLVKIYMNESGASEAEGCEFVKSLQLQTWKKMNEEVLNSPFSKSFTEIALNLTKIALFMYQHGDGHTVQDAETKKAMLSLLTHPIPMY